MLLEERRERHRQMLEAIRRNDIHRWYGRFCADLDKVPARGRELKISVSARAEAARPSWWKRTVGRFFSSGAS